MVYLLDVHFIMYAFIYCFYSVIFLHRVHSIFFKRAITRDPWLESIIGSNNQPTTSLYIIKCVYSVETHIIIKVSYCIIYEHPHNINL